MNIREEETTMNIQDLFNERNEQNKRITELVLKLEKQKEVLDKIKEYIENTDDFDIEIFDENSGGCLGTDLSKGAKHILELLEEIEYE